MSNHQKAAPLPEFATATKVLEEPVFTDFDDERLRAHRDRFNSQGLTTFGPPALNNNWYKALRQEAQQQLLADSWQLTGGQDQGEINQNNQRARLAPVARAFLSSMAVISTLQTLTGRRVAPSWSATCYTRYDGPGEHMGEHCDKADTCTYNLLTYLDVQWPATTTPSTGLSLFVFNGDSSATGLRTRISSHPNRMVAIHGSRHAHLRPALAFGESLTVLAGCFRCL